MKKKNVLLFFLFLSCFVFLSVSLSAEQMYSPSWGYALDLPEDFVLANREGNERYLFQHAILPVDLQIALYEEPQFKTVKEAAEHVFKQLKMTHKDVPFIWRNKEALLSSVSFLYSPSEKYKPKELSGWVLSLELPNKTGWLVLLTYTDKDKAKECENLMISSLDTVYTDTMSYFEPGPVTTALYPKTKEKTIEYTFNNKNISFTIDESDAEANKSVIDREFSVLTMYLNHDNLIAAWQRFYKIIFRDAWNRIAPASFAVYTSLFDENNQNGFAEKAAKELLFLVQNFNYERDRKGSDFINLPQALTEKRGDCDSRALLMVLMLKQMNIDAVLLVSPNKSHAIAAVDCPGSGTCFTHNGRDYLGCETTAHVPIGEIADEIAAPENWFPVDFYVIENFESN